MKQTKRQKSNLNFRHAFLALAVGIIVLGFPSTAAAADPIDYTQPNTLQLHVAYEGNDIQGMTYHIYQVGTGDESTSFSLAGAFAGYPVSLVGLTASGWQAAADDLAAFVNADAIAPLATDVTDVDGMIYFTGLPAGLYLVVGEDYVQGYSLFQVSPFLVALPHLQAGGSWQYAIIAYLKVAESDPEPKSTPLYGITESPKSVSPQTRWFRWPNLISDTEIIPEGELPASSFKQDGDCLLLLIGMSIVGIYGLIWLILFFTANLIVEIAYLADGKVHKRKKKRLILHVKEQKIEKINFSINKKYQIEMVSTIVKKGLAKRLEPGHVDVSVNKKLLYQFNIPKNINRKFCSNISLRES